MQKNLVEILEKQSAEKYLHIGGEMDYEIKEHFD